MQTQTEEEPSNRDDHSVHSSIEEEETMLAVEEPTTSPAAASPSKLAFWKSLPLLGFTSVFLVFLCEAIVYSYLFPFVGFMILDFQHSNSTTTPPLLQNHSSIISSQTNFVPFGLMEIASSSSSIEEDKSQVGYYAGLLAAAYSIAQLSNGFFMGFFLDWFTRTEARIQRQSTSTPLKKLLFSRRVLMFGSMFVNGVLNILFGFAFNYIYAWSIRFTTGLLNFHMNTSKAYLASIVTADSQSIAYSALTVFWGVGQSLGPLLGGFLSKMDTNFPTLFGGNEFLKQYPYLPPCICAGCCMMIGSFVILATTKFYDTKGKKKKEAKLEEAVKEDEEVEMEFLKGQPKSEEITEEQEMPVEETTVVVMEEEPLQQGQQQEMKEDMEEEETEQLSFWHGIKLRTTQIFKAVLSKEVLICYFLFFNALFMDTIQEELLPLWSMIDVERGGLGFSTKEIGLVQTIMGVLYIVLPFTFPLMERCISKLNLFRLGMLSVLPMCFTPQMNYLKLQIWNVSPENAAAWDGMVTWSGLFIYSLLRCNASTLYYTSASIMLNNAAPADKVASVMSISHSLVSFALLSGPLIGGPILSLSIRWLEPYLPLRLFMNPPFMIIGVCAMASLAMSFLLNPSINAPKKAAE